MLSIENPQVCVCVLPVLRREGFGRQSFVLLSIVGQQGRCAVCVKPECRKTISVESCQLVTQLHCRLKIILCHGFKNIRQLCRFCFKYRQTGYRAWQFKGSEILRRR